MNVERLLLLFKAVQKAISEHNIIDRLNNLQSALQNQVNDSGNPGHQQAVSSSLQELRSEAAAIATSAFPPSWHEMLVDLGMENVIGSILLDQVNEIFSRNQITPSIALSELKDIYTDLVGDQKAVNNLVNGLDRFGIEDDDLAPGGCEVGVLIPRSAVKSEVSKLGGEFREIGRIVGVFEELTTGSRRDPIVRTISSSAFAVFVETWPISCSRYCGCDRKDCCAL